MPVTRIRYVALWLAVAAFMLTYLIRIAHSIGANEFHKELASDVGAMALVAVAFSSGYALFQIPGGWLGDRIGPRRALALVVASYSAFACATAFAWNYDSLRVLHFLFGVCQAGTFAIATRSLSHWMLPGERGWAQGLMHAGVWLGLLYTPALAMPFIYHFGWRFTVFFLGLLGMVWAAVWFFWYRDTPAEHSWINDSERNLIQSGLRSDAVISTAVPWRLILSSVNVWTLSAMYFCCGWVLSTYLFLIPRHFQIARGTMGWYIASTIALVGGSLAGGWLSDRIGNRIASVTFGRQSVAIAGFLLAAACLLAATLFTNANMSVTLVYLGLFGIAMTVTVAWAVALDIGRDYTGTVAGVMNMAGAIGGALSVSVSVYIAHVLGWNHAFLTVAAMCVAGAVIFRWIDSCRPIGTSREVDRLETIERVFHGALARPEPERRTYVERQCHGDPELRREIESLLSHHNHSTTSFECTLQPVASSVVTMARAANELRQGVMLGPYRIDYKLGEGGMGAAYAATDTRLDRCVAVKVIDPALARTRQSREYFFREARSVAALAHPNVAVLHDVGETGEIPWIVMEYIAGTPLRSKLQSAPFADSTLLTYALQLAAALEHAHSRQIVHRDIKPENIIITGNDTLKVIDFGVALAMRDQLRSSADVNSRKFVGTLAYAAPELLSGGEASARSDIYSAGLVMYEMAYGQHPYSGLSGTALVEAVLTGTRSVAKSRSTSVSEGIDALIEQCLLRQPALRFSDGAALAAALRSIAADAARYWANLWARYP